MGPFIPSECTYVPFVFGVQNVVDSHTTTHRSESAHRRHRRRAFGLFDDGLHGLFVFGCFRDGNAGAYGGNGVCHHDLEII